ncbi:MAG TPA: H(+)/Cl(-) exchange transporter ClcA [Fimbriimonadaceae bacterium]
MAVEEADSGSRRAKRLHKREQLHREERHIHLIRAGIVGFLAGLLGVAYELAVNRAEFVASTTSQAAHRGGFFSEALLVVSTSLIGGTAAYLIGQYAPESGGSGIPHIKAALIHLRIIRPIHLIVAKFFGGLAAIFAGMSFGREGPTVQMGASIGKLVGDLMKVSRRGRTSLIAAGAGAGLAAAFNAPLAGFLFVMEELRREMSALTYGSALAASVCAVGVTRYLSGMRPSFNLPSPGPAPLSILPLVAILGVTCGIAGVMFNKTLMAGLEIRRVFKIPRWVYGGVAGLVSGLALLHFPEITGGGHTLAENLLRGQLQAGLFLLILFYVGKLLLTSASYGTGLPGGIFAPILVLGSLLGFIFGICAHAADPRIPFSNAGFASLGMSALLAGSVRAPLTGVVLIVEMTGEYGLLYSLLIAAFASSLTAEALKDIPIYDALMERDLHMSGAEVHPSSEPLLLEVLIEPQSLMDGVQVKNLKLPTGAILTTVDRDTRQIVPGGSTVLHAGDMVTILVEGDKSDLSLEIHDRAKGP